MYNAITDIEGIRVGHSSDFDGGTGCTVILLDGGATSGIDIRGSAAGTRQIDALGVAHVVEQVHAILLAGGSSFGLDATTGVMKYLEERDIGFDVGVARVPIVPSAVIFDLGFGNPKARPTAGMGYEACVKAGKIVEEGSVGVGVGATVGKLFAIGRAMKGGIGTASVAMPDGTVVGALVVVNAFGDIMDNVTGKIIAGARTAEDRLTFAGTVDCLKQGQVRKMFGIDNTTLAVVATNVQFNKKEITKVAQMAQGGLIKTITPVHTTFDGDLVFGVSLGTIKGDVNRIGVLSEFVVTEAIKRAVKKADGFGKLPAFKDIARGSSKSTFALRG
ncbi:MAG: Peptidase family S58 [Syntrophorhabdaceae bacterium PtaU1.Bin034]|nr:MAG: Peptidase family S58 [Syntrophorhabdaceae bacterium PtaU1.Bin034]